MSTCTEQTTKLGARRSHNKYEAVPAGQLERKNQKPQCYVPQGNNRTHTHVRIQLLAPHTKELHRKTQAHPYVVLLVAVSYLVCADSALLISSLPLSVMSCVKLENGVAATRWYTTSSSCTTKNATKEIQTLWNGNTAAKLPQESNYMSIHHVQEIYSKLCITTVVHSIHDIDSIHSNNTDKNSICDTTRVKFLFMAVCQEFATLI